MIRPIVILSLFFILLSATTLYSHAQPVQNDEVVESIKDMDSSATNSATPSAIERVQYELAYPGMLPDNPLYFLKTMRDGIVSFLISDPLKKADFKILTSDKRIFAAALLVEKEKYDLALETLSKSNNYLHEAVFSLTEAKESGKEIGQTFTNLENSVKKHKEVFSQQIEPHIPENMREAFSTEEKRFETIEKSVSGIKR